MKPLPAQHTGQGKSPDDPAPSQPPALAVAPAAYSTANRRAAGNPGQRVYPWLLFLSTCVAVAFCLLYITKPVINASQISTSSINGDIPDDLQAPTSPNRKAGLMPSKDRLPGEDEPASKISPKTGSEATRAAFASTFEHTNLRIQHILTAESPGGHLSKIDLDVPVLYQSRHLRWTASEVAEARELLARLADYQEKTQALRSEGAELLDSWNRLIGSSIPSSDLRADSPTLPTNQQDAADSPRPAGLDTSDLIKIQPSGK